MPRLEALVPSAEVVVYLVNLAAAVTLVCSMGLLTARACRHGSSPLRHGILAGTLALILLSPAAIRLAQQNRVAMIRIDISNPPDWRAAVVAQETTPRLSNSRRLALPDMAAPATAAPTSMPMSPPTMIRPASSSSDRPETDASRAAPISENASERSSSHADESVVSSRKNLTALSWWQMLGDAAVLVWAAGTGLGLLRLGRGCVRLARFCRRLAPLTDPRQESLACQTADALGLRKSPPVFLSRHLSVPVSIGLLKPAIVLPDSMGGDVDADQLQAVLLHEMAHIARRDQWVGVGQRIALVLFWWNPLVYWVCDAISELREEICDDHVVLIRGEGQRLARILVDLAARTTIRPLLPSTVGVLEPGPSGLTRRVARLVDQERNMDTRTNLRWRVILIASGLLELLGMASLGGLRLVDAPVLGAPLAGGDSSAAAMPGRPSAPPSETLLPDTTRGFISAPNVKELCERFRRTQLGRLAEDPAMKPFVEDLRRQLNERWSIVHARLGLTTEDLKGVAGGEVAIAAIEPRPDDAAVAILCDITGHEERAKALLEQVSGRLRTRGARQRAIQMAGTSVVVFDLSKQPGPGAERPQQHVVWLLKDNLLVASDDLATIEAILGRMAGKGGGSLAETPAFQAVMKRVMRDAGSATPQVRWFVQPLGYLEFMRTVSGKQVDRKGKSWIDIFKSQGFAAIRGVGGYVEFGVDRAQVIHRTAVWAPPPWDGSMNILSLPNHKEFGPPPWVASDMATCATLYCDLLRAFDNFGPLFDDLVGQGDTGIWQEVLDGLRKDPQGPRIDLRNELFAHLGPRIDIVTDYRLPITTTSERLVLAIEAKDEGAVAAALDKMFKKDNEMRRRTLEDLVIWESVTEETDALLPNAAVTAALGHLFIASHYDFLEKILTDTRSTKALASSNQYRTVQRTLDGFGMPVHAVQIFSLTDRQGRATYELLRQGKMPQSETMLGRVLNVLLGAHKGVSRKQELDARKMPDFDLVRRCLGPAGMQVVSEPDGWFLKGFMLSQ